MRLSEQVIYKFSVIQYNLFFILTITGLKKEFSGFHAGTTVIEPRRFDDGEQCRHLSDRIII